MIVAKLCRVSFLLAPLFVNHALSYLVDPPAPAASDTVSDCSNWAVASSGDTCASIASANSITTAELVKYNPSLAKSCKLIVGNAYCVEENWGIPPSSTSSHPSSTAPSKPTNGVATPTPIQTGMTTKCNKFYYVKTGDGCYDIAANNSIALSDFYAWNPSAGTNCQGLQAGYYVCVGIIGGTTLSTATKTATKTTSKTSSTKPANGITTPTPTQSGMNANCNKFYYVKSGDGCYDIAAAHSISLTQFYAWNPAVKSDCSALWPDYYVCVSIVGFTPTPSTTKKTSTKTSSSPTKTTGNGITTPTPTQSGMTKKCKRFYYVKKGDGCYNIATAYKITLDNFYAWNPAVKTDCSALWPNYYVCVGL